MNKSRAEAELDDELRAYVEMVTDEKVAAGVSPAEARRSTLAEFGGEQVKEAKFIIAIPLVNTTRNLRAAQTRRYGYRLRAA
jgi:hypothetical protein